MSHHSSHDNGDPFEKMDRHEDEIRQAMSKEMAKLLGEFPDGKLNAADEGAVSVAIGHEDGRVVMRFPKPVAWIGFTAAEAVDIAQTLLNHARAVNTNLLVTVRIG